MLCGLTLASAPAGGQQPATSVVWRQLSAGSDHTCSLTVDGGVYCWGANDFGQLGDGTRQFRYVPVPVAVRAGVRFQSVAAGGENSCALATDGSAWCWGDNRNGNVGDRTRVTRRAPTRVAGTVRFRAISLFDIPCAVAESGSTYCWGGLSTTPVVVPRRNRSEYGFYGTRSCDLTADSAVVCWGFEDSSASARTLPGGLRLRRLSLGTFACGLTADGAAYCWGQSVPGRPENPVSVERWYEPWPVVPDLRFRSIHVGWRSTCGLTIEGIPVCWGEGGYLMPGVPERQVAPAPVRIPVERPLVSLSFGRLHACGLTVDGAAYCWGSNGGGQLGDGTTTERPGAVRVAEPAAPGATDIPGPPLFHRPTVSEWVLPPGYDSTRAYPVIVFLPPTLGPATRPMGRYTTAVADHVVMLPRDTVFRDDFSDTEEFSEVFPRFERGVLADLAAFAATHRIDTTRVVLVGFGGGGDLAWTIAQRNPTRFAGAIVMGCPAGFRGPPTNLQTLAQRRARFFFSLGDNEAPARLRGVRATVALLQRSGIEHRFEIIPESDHVPAPAAMFAEALAFVLGPR
jgi:alpha-tubulin suppressor-like RCC1 family protein/predicted esterase